MNIEPRPDRQITAPESSETPSVGGLARRVGASLSPWQQHKVGVKIARRRERVASELARIEDEATEAQAVVVARGAVAATTERVEHALYAERLRCLTKAGELHEEALQSVTRLSEDSRSIFGMAVNEVGLRYAKEVGRRAGGIS